MRNIKSCLAYGAALCLVVISGLAYAQDDLDDLLKDLEGEPAKPAVKAEEPEAKEEPAASVEEAVATQAAEPAQAEELAPRTVAASATGAEAQVREPEAESAVTTLVAEGGDGTVYSPGVFPTRTIVFVSRPRPSKKCWTTR